MGGRPLAVGVDIGGTKCLAVALDGEGTLVASRRVPTPRSDVGALVGTVAALAEEVMVEAGGGDGATVGVGFPGLLDRAGVLRFAPHLPALTGAPLADALAGALRRPVPVTNDATCAALAEWRLGAGRSHDDVLLVTLGTGIGVGLVVGGTLALGAHGFAGEAGHMLIDPAGPSCPCGSRGCWERVASGSGLALLARRAAAQGRLAAVVRAAGGDVGDVRGEHVVEAARAGDDDALGVLGAFATWVARGLVNLVLVLDPGVVVLGGGLAASADVLLDAVRDAVAAHLPGSEHRSPPPVEVAALGEHAGAVGAALLGAGEGSTSLA